MRLIMNIEYLKKAKRVRKIKEIKSLEAPITEVINLESQIGKTFPKAYREFLFLCGNKAAMLAELDHEIDDAFERHILAKEVLEEEKFVIEDEYWPIASLDGCDQFYFFYFNDKTAQYPENPPVYICDRGLWEADEMESDYQFVRKMEDSFSDFINELITYRRLVGY